MAVQIEFFVYFVMHQNDSEILYLSLLVKLEDAQQIVQNKYVSDMSLSKCNGFKFSSVEFTKTKPKLKNKIWVQNAADVTENKILLRQNTFKLPQSVISSIRKELVFCPVLLQYKSNEDTNGAWP